MEVPSDGKKLKKYKIKENYMKRGFQSKTKFDKIIRRGAFSSPSICTFVFSMWDFSVQYLCKVKLSGALTRRKPMCFKVEEFMAVG